MNAFILIMLKKLRNVAVVNGLLAILAVFLLCVSEEEGQRRHMDLKSAAGLARLTRRVLGQFPASWILAD